MLLRIAHTTATRRTLPCMGRGEKLPGLRAARYAKGMRQVELAAAAKVNRTTIALIETGKAADAGTIRKLAAALGVEPADLLRAPTLQAE